LVIETPRLRLREWCASDAESFGLIARDPAVVAFITGGRPLTDQEVESFVERQITCQSERGWSRWALELKGSEGAVAGFCGPGCTFAPEIEMGWWLARELWGAGLATEAGRAATRHFFEVIGFKRLICCVHPDNAASLAVARKVGFEPVGRLEFQGMSLVRHALDNHLEDPPRDPRYVRDCSGAQPGSVTHADTSS
jgi:RimJ/RimL family protein N-acetyltransferase